MTTTHPLAGIYAAAVTPLKRNYTIDIDVLPSYLSFLADRGCHGALLLGTTGEGPSFSTDERTQLFKAAIRVRETHPDFRLLAGTGTPSLEETIHLTKTAFNLGFNAAVVLPPYYFHQAPQDGILRWFETLIRRAVPQDGYLLAYHFPAQSRVPIPWELNMRLKEAFPKQFAGLKDSSVGAEHAQQLSSVNNDMLILVGNDRFLSTTIEAGAAGCITAMANLFSPLLREIWDAHQCRERKQAIQSKINQKRTILDRYKPFPPTIKAALARLHGFALWPVKPPLSPLSPQAKERLITELTDPS